MRDLVRLSVLCPRFTASRHKLNWSIGHLYTVSGVKRTMRSQRLFGRIAEREEQMTSIIKKPSAMEPHNETEIDDKFQEMCVY